MVIPPIFSVRQKWSYAAIAKFCIGVITELIGQRSGGGTTSGSSTSSSITPGASIDATPPAETMFVSTATLLLRSSPNGIVVGKLSGGDSASVYERNAHWARISRDDAPPLWVLNSHLCSGEGCYVAWQSNTQSIKSQRTHVPVLGNSLSTDHVGAATASCLVVVKHMACKALSSINLAYSRQGVEGR